MPDVSTTALCSLILIVKHSNVAICWLVKFQLMWNNTFFWCLVLFGFSRQMRNTEKVSAPYFIFYNHSQFSHRFLYYWAIVMSQPSFIWSLLSKNQTSKSINFSNWLIYDFLLLLCLGFLHWQTMYLFISRWFLFLYLLLFFCFNYF